MVCLTLAQVFSCAKVLHPARSRACSDAFKQQVADRHAAEMARLRAAAEAKRREVARQRRAERLTAARKAYVEQCRVEINERWEEEKVAAEERAVEETKRLKARIR
jgi:hypothetical protein